MPVTELSPRFHDALAYASQHFHGRRRPNTRVPGIAHALAVTALVIDLADDEDEVLAALLHDVVEDGGGPEALDEIHRRFGREVADLVEESSDELVPSDRSWRERKAADLAAYPAKSPAALRIALADKADNTSVFLRSLHVEGAALFARHSAGDQETFLWYYRGLVEAFEAREAELGETGGALLRDFRHTVDALGADPAVLER